MDDFSRAVRVYLLLEKSEMKTILPNFCKMVHSQFGKLVKIIRSDNGTKFMCLSKYLLRKGNFIKRCA